MAKHGSKHKLVDDQVIEELDAIKRLLVLLLAKIGASQIEIAAALDIDRSNVSRLLPSRKIQVLDFIKK